MLPSAPRTSGAQTRRAWRILVVTFSCFAMLIGGLGFGVATYRTNATKPRDGTVRQIITGSQAQVRSRQQSFWHDVSEGSVVNEGDTIRTGGDTRMRIALFDNTIVELSENTIVAFDKLRATQYIAKNAAIQLRQDQGRVVVTENSETEYNRVQVDVLTQGTTIEARQPGTSFRVLVLPGELEDPGRVDVSVLNGADVTVQGAGQRVTVANGQQTVAAVGSAPSAPTVKQRELVENGDFKLGGTIGDKMPNHWQIERDDGGDGVGIRATAGIVPESIRGQPVNALHLVRAGGNVDSDQIGIQQTLAFSELDEFDSVVLSADVKIVSHSLSAGGVRGSEYPLILFVQYIDANNNPIGIGRAFYTQNDDGNRTDYGPVQGTQVKAGVWGETIHWDLKQVYPVPYKLVSLRVYASGHDYDAYVANISITAK
ncbi:MAG: FecR domain-containing protein [Thermomicrobiales bacterium]